MVVIATGETIVMRHLRLLIAIAALAAAALAPAGASALTVRGVVVADDTDGSGYVVTRHGGGLVVVRTEQDLAVGRRVLVRGERDASGAVVAASVRRAGRPARNAVVRGTVVARTAETATLAGNGAVVEVRTAAAAEIGADVVLRVRIRDGVLVGGRLVDDDPAEDAEFHGVVAALEAPTADAVGVLTLTLRGGATIGIVVPAGFDLGATAVGDLVEAKVAVAVDPTPTFTLVRLHGEDDRAEAGDRPRPERPDGQGRPPRPERGHRVEAKGILAIGGGTPPTITVAGPFTTVAFVVGSTSLAGFADGQCVEAKGHVVGATLTLERLEAEDDCPVAA